MGMKGNKSDNFHTSSTNKLKYVWSSEQLFCNVSWGINIYWGCQENAFKL